MEGDYSRLARASLGSRSLVARAAGWYGADPMQAASPIFDATEANFETEVLVASHHTPILVDFWAEWCPPCRVLTPVLERVVRTLGASVRLAKIEADDNMRLAGRYRLRGFPTVILFIAGAEVDRFSGARGETWVRDFLTARVAPPAGRTA